VGCSIGIEVGIGATGTSVVGAGPSVGTVAGGSEVGGSEVGGSVSGVSVGGVSVGGVSVGVGAGVGIIDGAPPWARQTGESFALGRQSTRHSSPPRKHMLPGCSTDSRPGPSSSFMPLQIWLTSSSTKLSNASNVENSKINATRK
jgi:hypothetical protein